MLVKVRRFCCLKVFLFVIVVTLLRMDAVGFSDRSPIASLDDYRPLPKIPNIDKEEAYKYMVEGECMGDAIEERQFSFWICKPYGADS